MEVKKITGEVEKFDKQKLCDSLLLAGASDVSAKSICSIVKNNIKHGSTTSTIFRTALKELVKENIDMAAKYSLKRGVSSLGPTGFLFEQYIEALLQFNGYETKRNQFMKGKCVEHEVDIFAKKDRQHYMIEAKYRNDPDIKTHINDVMYAHARMLDIRSGGRFRNVNKGNFHTWLVTNTRFTNQSEKYARCHSIRLTGWNHPHKNSLQNLIVRSKAYPITVIPALTKEARTIFTENNMILAQDVIPFTPEQLNVKFKIPINTAKLIYSQAVELLN